MMTNHFHVRFARGPRSFDCAYPTALERTVAVVLHLSLGYAINCEWESEPGPIDLPVVQEKQWPRIADDDDLTPDGRYMS